jgi:predicted acetyltransferase
MPATLILRRLIAADEEELMRAHRATSPGYSSFLQYYTEGTPFPEYLHRLAEQERGVGLLPDYVPSAYLFAFAGGRIVGRVSIRPEPDPLLVLRTGHIGYAVVPEFRRQGYGKAMLELALEWARDEYGLSRVLVTCDEDNQGSIRIIESCGGAFEEVVDDPGLEKPKRRYHIDIRPAASKPAHTRA